MYKKINIKFDSPVFDDIEPELKSEEELLLLVLKNAGGSLVSLAKYSEGEIQSCARQLINKGYLRGTIMDYYTCVWSKITKKGRFFLQALENDNLEHLKNCYSEHSEESISN